MATNAGSPSQARHSAITVLLFLSFLVAYVVLGSLLIGSELRFDFFGADVSNWFGLAREAEIRHPLIPLLTSPLAWALRLAIAEPGRQAVVFNAVFGAAAVTIAYHVLRRLAPIGPAFLLSVAYGTSMSSLIFGSIPESYALSSCCVGSAYLLYWLSVERRSISVRIYSLMTLLAIGVTVATAPQLAVMGAGAAWALGERRQLVRVFRAALIALAAVVVLIPVQTAVLRSRDLFSEGTWAAQMEDLREDTSAEASLSPTTAGMGERVWRSTLELARTTYVLAYVGARPGRTPPESPDEMPKIEYFGYPATFGAVGLLAAGLWLVVWGAGAAANLRDLFGDTPRPSRAFVAGLLVAIAGNSVLLATYNPKEMFLYTPLTALPVLLLGVNRELLARKAWQIALAGLVVSIAFNNVAVVLEMAR